MATTITFFPAGTTVIPGPFGGSLDQNPPTADRHVTSGGTDWAWTVFAVMFVSTFVAIAWTFIVSDFSFPKSYASQLFS